VRQIDLTLDELAVQWKEVEERVDALQSQQNLAFEQHEEIDGAVEAAFTTYYDASQKMDRLDDRIHQFKNRNYGDSWIFTALAYLAEGFLFVVWFIAKTIQLFIYKIPKFTYRTIIRFIAFFWWLIRWLLFLDYLWPS